MTWKKKAKAGALGLGMALALGMLMPNNAFAEIRTIEAEGIYLSVLEQGDPQMGGLYNNMGLALMDLDRFAEAEEAYCSGNYDMVILDELNPALFFGLLPRERAEALMAKLREQTELVVTGRNAPAWLLERADLVTEMKEIRHYYTKGIAARPGIEN